MTLGQRIAQKRKELGLSQEGLGEQLKVSRQAIYKWESDGSLPEIDKLITLSRIFSVSVGWLLGVEENAPETVNPDQEKLVEDVLSRYQPAPQKSAWDKWSVRILFALCGIMLALLVGTNSKVEEMDRQYRNLLRSIESITSSVDSQISAATRRMEESLKQQADLTAEWSAELVSSDPRTNNATFAIRVVPKTYTEGMTALFIASNGTDIVELPVEAGPGNTFSGEITCPLSDNISLSISLLSGGTAQNQSLRNFSDLYTASFPDVGIHPLQTHDPKDHLWPAKACVVRLSMDSSYLPSDSTLNFRVGLFRGTELVQWLEPDTYPYRVTGIDPNLSSPESCWSNSQPVTMESGVYSAAVLYTDEYDRQYVYFYALFQYDRSVTPPISIGIDVQKVPSSHDPADWGF